MTAASPADNPETLVAYVGCYTTKERNGRGDGISVYGSNRGQGAIAIFAVEEVTGVLAPVGWQPTQGERPRFAANQDSDTIVGFRVDPASGKLMPTGHVVKAASPSSIVFA